MSEQLPPPYPEIRDALRQGLVIPFLGAGASLGPLERRDPASADAPDYLPSARELAALLATRTNFPPDEAVDLAKVAQYYNIVVGRDRLYQALRGIFNQDYVCTSLHTYLADLGTPLLVVTTNYDDLLERALRGESRAYCLLSQRGRPAERRAVDLVVHTTDPALGSRLLWWPNDGRGPQEVSANKLDIKLETTTVVYKMHGTVDRRRPELDQYVIAEDDYVDFLSRMMRNTAIPSIFAEPFQTRHFLFLGYGLRDWNFRVVLNRMEQDLRRGRGAKSRRGKGLKSWAIQYRPSLLERRFLQERGVEVYDMTIDQFVTKLLSFT